MGGVEDADGVDALNLHSDLGVFHALKRFSFYRATPLPSNSEMKTDDAFVTFCI